MDIEGPNSMDRYYTNTHFVVNNHFLRRVLYMYSRILHKTNHNQS